MAEVTSPGAPSPAPLRTVDEQLQLVLDGVGSLDPIELTLLDAQGLLLAEDVRSDFPLPSFDNSSMDGYAVRAIDTRSASADKPVRLQVVGDIAAGATTRGGMGPGLAMRIMTGAPNRNASDSAVCASTRNRAEASSAGAGAMPARWRATCHSSHSAGAGSDSSGTSSPVTGSTRRASFG